MTKPATAKKEEASAALSSASPNESANVFTSERAKSAGQSPAAAKKEEAGTSISSVSPVHRENASVSSTPSMVAKPTARPTIEQVRK